MSAKRKPAADPMAAPEISLPHNLELERAFLGCLMVNPKTVESIEGEIEPEHFYEEAYGKVFETVVSLAKAGKTANPVVLKDYLHDIDFGETKVGEFCLRLVSEATTAINAVPFARTIRDIYGRRELIRVADEMRALAVAPKPDTTAVGLLDEIEARLAEVRSFAPDPHNVINFRESVAKSIEAVAKAYQNDAAVAGMSTGFPDLDLMIGGLSATDVLIVAGRPASGKSALAVNIARAVALAHPDRTAFLFSQEMSDEQVAMRELSYLTKIPAVKLKNGKVSQTDFDEIMDAGKSLQMLNIAIDPAASIKLSYVGTTLRKFVKRGNTLSLVVIDYLQLMTGPGNVKGRNGSRAEEMAAITQGLKTLAKEFNVPFIVISQLSRKTEERDDKRPMLSDLRESGSIEQDADVVMFVYREEYYLQQRRPVGESGEKWEKWKAEMDQWKGLAEIIIGKNRHGPQGVCLLGFDGDTTSFRNLDEDEKRVTPSDAKPAKIRINKSIVPFFKALESALANCARTIAQDGVPPDCAVVTTTEWFDAYFASRVTMEGDNLFKAREQERKPFREAMQWMIDEGVVQVVRGMLGEQQIGWAWRTERKVRL